MDWVVWIGVSSFIHSFLVLLGKKKRKKKKSNAERCSAALILFTVLLIRFLANLPNNHDPPTVKGQHFMDILIVAVTVIVVAIPGTLLSFSLPMQTG